MSSAWDHEFDDHCAPGRVRRLTPMPASRSKRRDILILAVVHLVLYALLFRPWTGEGCDGVHYYTFLSSFLFDGDVDTTNDFALSSNGIHTIYDQTRIIGPNGFIVNQFPVGNAVLWFPFVLPVRLVGWVAGLLFAPGPSWAFDRYSLPYCFAVSLAGVFYGYFAVVLIYLTCRMQFRRVASMAAALGAVYASPALFYTFYSPEMSHVGSAFCVALLVYASYRCRHYRGVESYLLIGLAAALAMLVRSQDVVFMAIPFAFWLRAMRGNGTLVRLRACAGPVALAAVVFAAIVMLQLCCWRICFGKFVTVPQGSDYMRWNNPSIGLLLFSGWHGLFYYHPLLLLGAFGILVTLVCTRGALVPAAIAASALAATYVNACCFDWYGNASFGARRFCSLLPCLAIGMAGVYHAMGRRWRAAPTVLSALAIFANILLTTAYARRVFDVYFFSELWAMRGDLPRLLLRYVPTILLESQQLSLIVYRHRWFWPAVQMLAGGVVVAAVAVPACRGWFRKIEKHAVVLAGSTALLFAAVNLALLFLHPQRDVLGQEFRALVKGNLPDDQKRKELARILDAGYRNPAAVFYKHGALKDRSNLQRDLDLVAGVGPGLCAKWIEILPKDLVDAGLRDDIRCRPVPRGGQFYLPGHIAGKAHRRRHGGDLAGEASWLELLWSWNPFDVETLNRLAENADETGDAQSAREYRELRTRILRAKAFSFIDNVRHVTNRNKAMQRDYRLRLFQPWYQEPVHVLAQTYLGQGEYRKVLDLCVSVERDVVLPAPTREIRAKAQAALRDRTR